MFVVVVDDEDDGEHGHDYQGTRVDHAHERDYVNDDDCAWSCSSIVRVDADVVVRS